jgi:hypothetical protein
MGRPPASARAGCGSSFGTFENFFAGRARYLRDDRFTLTNDQFHVEGRHIRTLSTGELFERPKALRTHDRDVNAATNPRNMAVSSTASACGGEGAGPARERRVKPAQRKQESNGNVNYG